MNMEKRIDDLEKKTAHLKNIQRLDFSFSKTQEEVILKTLNEKYDEMSYWSGLSEEEKLKVLERNILILSGKEVLDILDEEEKQIHQFIDRFMIDMLRESIAELSAKLNT